MTVSTILYPPNNPPKSGSDDINDPKRDRDAGLLLTFADLEARLVDAIHLQWRTEGGAWPFASDGPWHLVKSELWGPDVDKARMPRLPLSRTEMAALSEAMGWLTLVPADFDRRLIVLAVTRLAKGDKQVPWRRLLRVMGLERGADGLRMKYGRAMSALVMRLNTAEKRT